MTPLLTRAQMRAFDAHAIEALGVPSLVLMENAARGATDALLREALDGDAEGAVVAIVCGVGNNGGDGLAMARLLAARGARVSVVVVGDPAKASAEAHTHLDVWTRMGGALATVTSDAEVSRVTESSRGARVVVDALFGTGLDRPVRGIFAAAIEALAASSAPKLAVDLPSGLDADTGSVFGACARASWTVTLGHPKRGLYTPRGAALAGRVVVADIGVSGALPAGLDGVASLMSREDSAAWLPRRGSAAHKGTGGHVLVVGGAPGTVGAPQLTARAALRAGAGLATLATWTDVARTIEGQILEVMTASIDPAKPTAKLDRIVEGKKALAVGPGLGKGDAAKAVVAHVLSHVEAPIVLDADGLAIHAGRPEALRVHRRLVITPHPGEAAQLLGVTVDDIEADRFSAAARLAERTGAVVVLKGAHTIVTAPGQAPAVSPVACAALATAGSGDTLTGIVAALACSLSPLDAARAGVLLHAVAAEVWSAAHGGADRGMLASDLAELLPGVVASLASKP